MVQEIERGVEAWNVAQGYTQLKILKPLVEMDKLVKIALYGSEDIDGSLMLMNQPELKGKLRIEAILRLIDLLKEIIENSHFACKKGNSKEEIQKLNWKIKEVENVISAISTEEIDQRNSNTIIRINEKHFRICLDHLREIKKEITEPLNKNSLIFPSSEEIDLDKIKQQLIEGG